MYLTLTFDVDPDANCPLNDHYEAVTAGSDRISVDGCRQGLRILHDLLNELSLPATFFWEARTLRLLAHTNPDLIQALSNNAQLEHGCHALRHEDLTGDDTNIIPSANDLDQIISEATRVMNTFIPGPPSGFRGPYCRLPEEAITFIARRGYLYDASKSLFPGDDWDMRPYKISAHRTNDDVWELAMARWHDSKGDPIDGYLWQLFENKRTPTQYIRAIQDLIPRYPDGLYQIGIHPWHLIKNQDGAAHPHPEKQVQQLRTLLETIGNLSEIQCVTLEKFLQLTTGVPPLTGQSESSPA